MIKVAQHIRMSRAHIHTKKPISMTATTKKQRTRHDQILHSYMLILTNTLSLYVPMHACFQTNKCMHR